MVGHYLTDSGRPGHTNGTGLQTIQVSANELYVVKLSAAVAISLIFTRIMFLACDSILICFVRNKKVYEPPRYMAAAEAAQQLMTVVANRRASDRSDLGNQNFFMSTLFYVLSAVVFQYAIFWL